MTSHVYVSILYTLWQNKGFPGLVYHNKVCLGVFEPKHTYEIANCKNLRFHMRSGILAHSETIKSVLKHFNLIYLTSIIVTCGLYFFITVRIIHTAYFHALFNLGTTYCILSLPRGYIPYLVSTYFLRR